MELTLQSICAFMASSKIAVAGAQDMSKMSCRFSCCHYSNVMGGVISAFRVLAFASSCLVLLVDYFYMILTCHVLYIWRLSASNQPFVYLIIGNVCLPITVFIGTLEENNDNINNNVKLLSTRSI